MSPVTKAYKSFFHKINNMWPSALSKDINFLIVIDQITNSAGVLQSKK